LHIAGIVLFRMPWPFLKTLGTVTSPLRLACRTARINPALLGAFHESQAMVVGVFHLTHQIEITNGGSHDAVILPVARRPALPPAGRPSPSASFRSNTSTSLGGYDVSRLSHAALAVDNSRCAMLPSPYITTTLLGSIVRNTQ